MGIVQHRPFKRSRTRTRIVNKIKKNVKLIHPQFNIPIQYFRLLLIVAICLYGIFFVIKNTLFRAENYIQNISYGKNSVQMYDNPELYKKVGDLIRGENYYVVSFLKKGKILNEIKSGFVMVKNIEIVQPQKYGAAVQFEFYEPDIVIKLGDKKFGVIGDLDFEIFSGNELGKDTFFVELPQYASGLDSIYGLFYEIPRDKFIYDMTTLAVGFPNYKRIVYLPGSTMTAVFLSGGQRLYINNQNSITGQIDNYEKLMKFYDKASTLKIIDLGSLEGNKIIVQ